MTTARSLIEQALKKNNVLGVGQSLNPEDAADGLIVLNNMLDSWSVEGGMVFTESRETFNLTNLKGEYTIGAGGDFSTVKPYSIQAAFVTQSTNDYSLQNYDQKQYAQIPSKDTSGIPTIFYFDNNFPLATVFLYPVPTATPTITIYSTKILNNFANLTTDVSMPAGYDKAIIDNLSIELAPYYEKVSSVDAKEQAKLSKGVVFTSNNRNENNIAYVDNALIGRRTYNIFRGV